MYPPLVKAFNYALDRLSKLDVPGLPKFREKRQIVFACSATKYIKSESYLQGSYKPDIVLVKWNTFKKAHKCPGVVYSESYKSDVCYRPDCDQPMLSWRNILSTLEVKRGAGNTGNRLSKGKTKGKPVHSTYTSGFEDLTGDLGTMVSPRLPARPVPLKMVREEYPTRSRKSTPPSFPLLTKSSQVTSRSEKPGGFTLDFGMAIHITEEAHNPART